MAKGDFTPTRLADIQLTLEKMWKEPQYSKFYEPKGETIKAIRENQTATFVDLAVKDKEREVAVKWADFCDQTAAISTNPDDCDPGDCDTPDPKTKTYKPNIFIEDCFSVREEDFQTSVLDMNETIAKGQAAKIKNIIELFNAQGVSLIDANRGVDPIASAYGYPATNNRTAIPREDFNMETFYPYIAEMLTVLRSSDNYILDGRNFMQAALIAEKNNLNDNGKLDFGLFNLYPYYNDLLGFIQAGVPNNTYVIDKGAVAVQTREKYDRRPREVMSATNPHTRYSIDLPGYPGMGLDVRFFIDCVDDSLVYKWKFKLRALIAVNPITCGTGNTGIWAFTKPAVTP